MIENASAGADGLLTTRQVAQYLNLHEKTVRRWTRDSSNPLPCVRVRSRVRYSLRDVLAWLSASGKEGRE